MFSVVFVCPQGGIITHDALEFTMQGPISTVPPPPRHGTLPYRDPALSPPLVASGSHEWRPVQTWSLEDLRRHPPPPTPLTGSRHPNGMFFVVFCDGSVISSSVTHRHMHMGRGDISNFSAFSIFGHTLINSLCDRNFWVYRKEIIYIKRWSMTSFLCTKINLGPAVLHCGQKKKEKENLFIG